jgi:hypothetical protein
MAALLNPASPKCLWLIEMDVAWRLLFGMQ